MSGEMIPWLFDCYSGESDSDEHSNYSVSILSEGDEDWFYRLRMDAFRLFRDIKADNPENDLLKGENQIDTAENLIASAIGKDKRVVVAERGKGVVGVMGFELLTYSEGIKVYNIFFVIAGDNVVEQSMKCGSAWGAKVVQTMLEEIEDQARREKVGFITTQAGELTEKMTESGWNLVPRKGEGLSKIFKVVGGKKV